MGPASRGRRGGSELEMLPLEAALANVPIQVHKRARIWIQHGVDIKSAVIP